MPKPANQTDAGVPRTIGMLWLPVASGGWWKTNEIADAAGVDMEWAQNRLNYMAHNNYVVRRELPANERKTRNAHGARDRMEYAVLPECMVPPGLTAQQLTKALLGGEAA